MTNFVVDNFDNVLGPFIFIQMSSSVPQVEHIWSKAPDTFKHQAMVSDFYHQVTSNAAAALHDNASAKGSAGSASPQDIDDATIQDILNGK